MNSEASKGMEFGDVGEVAKKRMSFGLSVADEKIKLIDILSEDDYFLVTSPLCDHPLQPSFSEVERKEKKEQESRPSFLRRSLAWDSAFSSSAGVLDPDELSLINNGFIPANHEIRNRRSETPNHVGSSDTGPPFLESKTKTTPKSGLKQIFQSSLMVDKSCKNKIKSDHSCIRKGINSQNEGKMRKESKRHLSEKVNLNVDSKVRSGIATAASRFLKRKTNSIRSENSASEAPSKKKGMATHSTTLLNQRFLSPPPRISSSGSLTSPVRKQRRSVDSNDVKEASSLQSRENPLSSRKQHTSSTTLSAKSMKPSGLRPPSPHLRYFDEGPYGGERIRKMPQKVVISEGRKFGKNMNEDSIDGRNGKKGLNQLDNLCTSLEAVDLKEDKSSRTPLAEKTSSRNSGKKHNFLRRASSVRYG